jgi:hypothetical protein
MQRIWWFECNLIIIFKGFVNIFQAWWHFNAFIYRKTHSHCFTGLYIRILTANHNFYIFKTWLFVSIKNLVLGRETYLALIIIFFLHIIVESFESWTLNVSLQRNFPVSKLILERFKSFEYIFTSILIFWSLITNFFFFFWFFRGNDWSNLFVLFFLSFITFLRIFWVYNSYIFFLNRSFFLNLFRLSFTFYMLIILIIRILMLFLFTILEKAIDIRLFVFWH